MIDQNTWVRALNSQYEGALSSFEQALTRCPDELWQAAMWADPDIAESFSHFWYVAYHELFYLDLYLGGQLRGFTPPAPFSLSELDPNGVMPERTYRREELLAYLAHCRQKCENIFANLSDEAAQKRCDFPWMRLTYVEVLIDNLRHVQEHTAQLNMFLGQQRGIHAKWFSGGAEYQ